MSGTQSSSTHTSGSGTRGQAGPHHSAAQEDAVRRLTEALGGTALEVASFRDNVRVYLKPDQLIAGLNALKSAGYELTEVGAADYLKYPGKPGSGERFEVHYVLLNRDTATRMVLKVGTSEPTLSVPSCTAIWTGADWMEREVFDMYGIRFSGHPDLRRILMPEEFTAYPLRKDYPLRGRGERHNFPVITREQS